MGDSMAEAGQSPASSPQDEIDDNQWQHADDTTQADENGTTTSDGGAKPAMPMQKRRRVTRACDECRRKKIKCDGKQPCTHCTVYSYDCTYDQPSNRRRNPAPQYIEALEARLQKAESILRVVLPNLDLDDPKVEARGIDQILAMSQRRGSSGASRPASDALDEATEEAQLESMVQNTGSLDLDDSGNWDYHGGSSGYLFLRRLRKQMGESMNDPKTYPIGRQGLKPSMMDAPKSASGSPSEGAMPNVHDLPPRDVARALCRNALDDACALMRPLHQPSFYEKLDKLYNTDPDRWTNDDLRFLPLLYVVIAVGCMFSTSDDDRLDKDGYEKYIGQGYQYFNASRQMLDVTEIRDLMSLKTVTFMIIFLQSTAKLSTRYSLVGIAMRACLRLGLHRNLHGKLNFIEQQERKRIFWLIKRLDAYVSAMLGLPQILDDEDVDQEFPAEVDDDRITLETILPQPPNKFPLIKATNAHTRLTAILKKVVKYIYPIKGVQQTTCPAAGGGYMISHAKIREIEGDLQVWMDQLPMELRPSDDAPQDLARVQQLLRMSYAHLQMMMYRPFLHYVASNCQSRNIDKRTFACAAACVSVARNIVHITTEMKKRGLLIGAYWFVMYTTYFAIVSLVYFCLENPKTTTSIGMLKDAVEGREVLASLARRSLAADRCTQSLESVFANLPEKIQDRKNSQGGTSKSQGEKRPPPKASTDGAVVNKTSPPPLAGSDPIVGTQRACTFPNDRVAATKQLPSHDPSPFRSSQTWNLGSGTGGVPTPEAYAEHIKNSPQSSNMETQFGNPNLPDLKNLMFPSDNPFAYPNQPISTLEGASFAPDTQTSQSMYYMPTSAAQGSSAFEGMAGPVYGNFAPFLHSRPPTQGGINNSNAIGDGHPSMSMANLQQINNNFGGGSNDEFWASMGSNRQGLTPGVNLEDLFGSEQFNTIWDNPGATNNAGFGMP